MPLEGIAVKHRAQIPSILGFSSSLFGSSLMPSQPEGPLFRTGRNVPIPLCREVVGTWCVSFGSKELRRGSARQATTCLTNDASQARFGSSDDQKSASPRSRLIKR